MDYFGRELFLGRTMANWHTISCEDCGGDLHIREDWDHPPRRCKSCKERNAAKWSEKSCEGCGTTIKACTEWEHQPKFCKACKALNAPKDVACSQCGKRFQISTGFQLKCRENGWDLPTRCHECKDDALLIKGAIGALRDEFPFVLETTIEKRGHPALIFSLSDAGFQLLFFQQFHCMFALQV